MEVIRSKREDLIAALSKLSEREVAVVIARHYGGLTFKEIGLLFHRSHERMSQVYHKAIMRLQWSLKHYDR
jgi:RNA polymerase sigma factor (sigma-70 family)